MCQGRYGGSPVFMVWKPFRLVKEVGARKGRKQLHIPSHFQTGRTIST